MKDMYYRPNIDLINKQLNIKLNLVDYNVYNHQYIEHIQFVSLVQILRNILNKYRLNCIWYNNFENTSHKYYQKYSNCPSNSYKHLYWYYNRHSSNHYMQHNPYLTKYILIRMKYIQMENYSYIRNSWMRKECM